MAGTKVSLRKICRIVADLDSKVEFSENSDFVTLPMSSHYMADIKN